MPYLMYRGYPRARAYLKHATAKFRMDASVLYLPTQRQCRPTVTAVLQRHSHSHTDATCLEVMHLEALRARPVGGGEDQLQ